MELLIKIFIYAPPLLIAVILHEIAHALVGNKHKHNSVFQQKAHDIGCKYTNSYCFDNINSVPKNVVAKCPRCGHLFKRYRKPSSIGYCGRCKDVSYEERLLVFERVVE